MKKHLSLAVLLGALAFVGVSYIAQAEEVTAPAADVPAVVAPAAGAFAVDHDACLTLASSASTEGETPSAEAVDASYKKCMSDKGYSDEALHQHQDAVEQAPAIAE